MIYPEDKERKEITDKTEDQHLVLDGTANLDYSDESQVPRVKGLIELFSQYLSKKPKEKF